MVWFVSSKMNNIRGKDCERVVDEELMLALKMYSQKAECMNGVLKYRVSVLMSWQG